MEKVIAVIVTYNRIKLLKECLNAVLSQTYKVHKIVLLITQARMEPPICL